MTFDQVSGSSTNGYVTDSWSDSKYNNNLECGFITKYARHSPREDFAEMMSVYVTNSAAWWEARMVEAGDGRSTIETKLGLVKNYMLETFGIELDDLRDAILRRQDEVMAGKVDLTNIDL